MANSTGIISTDDHVQELPDLWTSRLSSALKDRAPRLVSEGDRDVWMVDGRPLLGGNVCEAGGFLSDRTGRPSRWSEVPPAAYSPEERLKAMDAGGIAWSVLFPTVAGMAGEGFGSITDPSLELACVQAYNDWLIQEWGRASDRFVPQCIVPIGEAGVAVREIERCVAMGHRGVVFPSMPMLLRDGPHLADSDYDPVWDACEQLGVPLALHSGATPTLHYAAYEGLAPKLADAIEAVEKPVSSVFVFSVIAFSKLLLRHPRLKVVLAESALSWGLLALEWADHQFEHDGLPNEGYDLKPSEMFRRQCYFNTWFDDVAPFIPFIGADNIVWSANLPLPTTTWPRTQESIDRTMAGLSSEDRNKVLYGNAAALYRIG